MEASGHLLVSFDRSNAGERRLRAALAEARRIDARLTVAILIPIEEPSPCCDRKVALWNHELRRVAQDEAEHVRESLPSDLSVDVVVHEGHGSRALAELAERLGCDTVIKNRRRAIRDAGDAGPRAGAHDRQSPGRIGAPGTEEPVDSRGSAMP